MLAFEPQYAHGIGYPAAGNFAAGREAQKLDPRLSGAVMAAVYLAVLALLRTPELQAALAPVLARLGR